MQLNSGKPVCAVHFHRGATSRCGLVTAQHAPPKGKHLVAPHPWSKSHSSYLPADVARKVAEAQPGGAIIVWQEGGCEFARVYSRADAPA